MERTPGRAWIGGAIAVVVATGLLNLPLPFFGDQALYSVMASMMGDGAALYTDVWDLKQPGIFVFYLAAGSGLGFTEIGIHVFEIMWWSAFMVVLWLSLRRILASPIAIAATIGLIGGGYYLAVSPAELTQVEGLVGFPMFSCMWFAYRSEWRDADPRRSIALSGVLGGVVLLFKLIFLPIVATMWLIAVLAQDRDDGVGRGIAIRALSAGLLVPVGLTALVLAVQGSLGAAIGASLVYPVEVLGVDDIGYGLEFLRRNVTWFAVMFLPIHLLALLGMWQATRGERRRFDLYTIAWLITGGIVILIQVSSWFSWHFLLLLVPIGLFAGRGVEWIVTIWTELTRPKRTAIALAVVVALIPPLYGGLIKLVPLATNGLALSDSNRSAYEQEVWPKYAEVRSDGAILDDPSSPPGPIYVFGDPTYNFLFKRDQAVPVHGWTPQLHTTEMWKRVSDDLVVTRPSFIHVAEWTEDLVETRGQGIAEFIASDYEVARRSEFGTWYVIRR